MAEFVVTFDELEDTMNSNTDWGYLPTPANSTENKSVFTFGRTAKGRTVKVAECVQEESSGTLALIHQAFGDIKAVECSAPSSIGNRTTAKLQSSTIDDNIIENDDPRETRSILDGLSAKLGDVPLSSQSSAAIFKEAQAGLERLLLDLRSFDDETDFDLSVASGDGSGSCTPVSSSGTSAPEDDCDEGQDQHCPPEEGQRESQQAPGSTSQRTEAGDQGNDGSDRKRRRLDEDDEDHSRATVKTKRKKPVHDREQMLICCFKDDSQTPCSGTDKSVGEVIERLASSHHVFICKTCWVLLIESESGDNVHPDGVECVAHCLSPRCLGDPATTTGQKHRFSTKSCGTKTGRPRPEDRESIYRYIFKLVHPTREIPANVFTTGRTPHLGMNARQGKRKPTRDELEWRVQDLNEQFEELRKRDSANTRKLEALSRDLEAERNITNQMKKKMQRLQDIIVDALQPGMIVNEAWGRSLRRRTERDAPEALEMVSKMNCAKAPLQPLQTPPGSLHDVQPSTMPTPNDTGTTGQDQQVAQGATSGSHLNERAHRDKQDGLYDFVGGLGSDCGEALVDPSLSTNPDVGTERQHAWSFPEAPVGGSGFSNSSAPTGWRDNLSPALFQNWPASWFDDGSNLQNGGPDMMPWLSPGQS
jgi:hypothetical protein